MVNNIYVSILKINFTVPKKSDMENTQIQYQAGYYFVQLILEHATSD